MNSREGTFVLLDFDVLNMKPPRQRPPGVVKTLRYLRQNLRQFSALEDFTLQCCSQDVAAALQTLSCSLPQDAKARVLGEIQEALSVIKAGKCPEFEDVEVRVEGVVEELWQTLQENEFRNTEFVMQVLQGIERSIGYISELNDGRLNARGTAALLAIWELKAYLRSGGACTIAAILILVNKLAEGKFFTLPLPEDSPSFSLELDLDVLVANLPEEQATTNNNLISEILRNDGFECQAEFLRSVSEYSTQSAPASAQECFMAGMSLCTRHRCRIKRRSFDLNLPSSKSSRFQPFFNSLNLLRYQLYTVRILYNTPYIVFGLLESILSVCP
ncbi:hypothetical protein CPB83DRAFT_890466 [Crepidotus variabilis]|uniref:Uncharacterized protein n=1 Tax=Crepidotus variabilis TaxID=179855 RepID=A0A9P6JUS7_9AGAR|nr:hypothetical protein CPB83DRAFT_890466 [Crepidotus variabilis]